MNGTIFLHGSLARSIAPRLRRVEPAPKPETQQEPPLGLVVLDPGHGGRDPGAIGCNGMFEKDCVLFVAHRVCRRLAESKVKVIMTRSDDRFVTLEGRAEIANRAQADLFVSNHADSAPRRAANGHTLYVARGASGAAAMAARCIAGRLAEIGIYSRGVREANYRVLVQTTCPAALVEIGYLSNHDEARRLATGRHRLAVGDAIAKGIVDALRKQSKDPTGR